MATKSATEAAPVSTIARQEQRTIASSVEGRCVQCPECSASRQLYNACVVLTRQVATDHRILRSVLFGTGAVFPLLPRFTMKEGRAATILSWRFTWRASWRAR